MNHIPASSALDLMHKHIMHLLRMQQLLHACMPV
jgi:hypothetical protein